MSPELRKARFAMAMRLMQNRMLDEVETADVVVTNPTHYAVAVKYEQGIDEAPMVLAKGRICLPKESRKSPRLTTCR